MTQAELPNTSLKALMEYLRDKPRQSDGSAEYSLTAAEREAIIDALRQTPQPKDTAACTCPCHDDGFLCEECCEGPRHAQRANRLMVVHGNGDELTTHPVDQPCGKCRPPVEITNAIVERAVKAWRDEYGQEYPGSGNWPAMHAALEAAFNG